MVQVEIRDDVAIGDSGLEDWATRRIPGNKERRAIVKVCTRGLLVGFTLTWTRSRLCSAPNEANQAKPCIRGLARSRGIRIRKQNQWRPRNSVSPQAALREVRLQSARLSGPRNTVVKTALHTGSGSRIFFWLIF